MILPKLIIAKKEGAKMPSYATPGSAAADLCANETVDIIPGKTAVIGTGLSFEIPEDYEVQIRSRSGLSARGIIVANAPGTIDSDYRGEIKIILINLSQASTRIEKGDRIAQMVFAKVERYDIKVLERLETDTERGINGIGSTGIR